MLPPVRLDPLASSFLIGPAALAGWSASKLVDGQILGADGLGIVLLAIALVYATLCGLFFRRQRELSIVLAAIAITVATIAFAQLTGGATLAIVWAVEGAALAWLAVRIGEARFQLGAIASLGLAVVHVLAYESRHAGCLSSRPIRPTASSLCSSSPARSPRSPSPHATGRPLGTRKNGGCWTHRARAPRVLRSSAGVRSLWPPCSRWMRRRWRCWSWRSGWVRVVLDRFMAGRVGVSVLWALVGKVLVVAGAAGRRFGVGWAGWSCWR